MGEFIGTMILILVGDGVAAMAVLYGAFSGDYWGIAIGWGVGVAIAIYVVGTVSGAHINPAVTVALAMFKGFPWKKVVPYILAQTAGAFVGAALVYQMYWPIIDLFNKAHHMLRGTYNNVTFHIFFTGPFTGVTSPHAFVDEIILTGMLVLGVFAVIDQYNTNAPQGGMAALIIGLIVAAVGNLGGNLEAWPLNPARDFGPRVFGWLMGWGQNAFPGVDGFWWVPIVAPVIGGVIGAAVYQYLVHPYLVAMREADQAQ